ncbi:type 2 periplasmic-binding domain-containing protein [Dongshaea marina]|uniref:amino acid ABC transporter substrate-binding protein n=1 Tax=Dongshaea marina TaxID=2047966 RepID=UPI00131F195B|nr:amino acid ABC transporter substrate-binding protein [Dongshaea marina]
MRYLWHLILLILLLPIFSTKAAQQFIYPRQPDNQRHAYLIELLKLAIDKTTANYGAASVLPSKKPMFEGRYIKSLLSNKGDVTVIWTSTSFDKEQQMLPVRIPLYRGLLGYRIPLIDRSSQAKLTNIDSLCMLRELRIGQGAHWGDVAIYQENGFKVTTTPIYHNLVQMLSRHRFDLLPLGITEIITEQSYWQQRYPHLVIESSLLIHYPFAYYFFVNKKEQQMAARLAAGLETMLNDGSFDQLFEKHYARDLETLKLNQRRLFELSNPELPPSTPLHRLSLWFKPLISPSLVHSDQC